MRAAFEFASLLICVQRNILLERFSFELFTFLQVDYETKSFCKKDELPNEMISLMQSSEKCVN